MNEANNTIRQRRALSPAQAYELAVSRHRAGRLDQAEQLYRAVIEAAPGHFGAIHYLGLVCTQQRKFDEALSLLQQAVAIEPISQSIKVIGEITGDAPELMAGMSGRVVITPPSGAELSK